MVTALEFGQLWGDRFDADAARAELAVQVQEIRKDGIFRAQKHVTGDREFDEATDAMIRQRSITALIAAHEKHKARRHKMSTIAVRLFAQAAELAPVFGMVGTLVALSHLPRQVGLGGDFAGAIGMAVQTTLYGLLAANLLFAPIARFIDRRARVEESERQRLVDWLASQLSEALPLATGSDRRTLRQESA
jgi:chemotaxis protein MotA